ncbi:Gfo/Idh/MocA family oxidoreductase [Steroidobacter cummioxidans]|uniref:Gfo/Idh/MocA family oxidoreductase n=1 Tax=Steroidobacter cummioxidans TaxID=1803913 RepID=UPI0019D4CFE5|nr:Gfo/Idh/MocA family oxidoreductase [Steroidobacter cummioxidans]
MSSKTRMYSSSSPSRRSFLTSVATLGAVSTLAPGFLKAQAANGLVNVAYCGIGNRGEQVIKSMQATGLANVVALCDTDMGAPHTKEVLGLFPGAARFQDFRRMFDKMGRRIDAVVVSTPDFSHFPIAMLAMSQGKHVYCEKPMGQSFRQIELMMQAEHKYKVAAQMGNQGHSDANYHQFKAWVDAGIIRNVTRITAFMNNSRRWHGMKVSGRLPKQAVPPSLDWESWLATAAEHDYNVGYVNGEWRSWFDFGNGALGDWGAHIFDTAHEFLELGLPNEVVPVVIDGHSPYIFPQASTLAFRFPARGSRPPVELTWYDGQRNLPPLPPEFAAPVADPNIPPPSRGSADAKVLPPGKVIYADGLTFQGGTHGSTLKIIPESKALDLAGKLPMVPSSTSNHFENFLLACQGEERCRSSFAVAGPLCQVMALGVIAQRLNTTLAFDSTTRKIANHKVANELLAGAPPRKGWEQYYKL